MPPLLQRFRFKHAAASPAASENKRSAPRLGKDWVFWTCAVLIVVGIFGIYFWVTSARILKEPLRLDYGPNNPAFTAALGPMVGAEFNPGNSVQSLVNGDQFFPAMLEAIRGAKRSITMETYIWAPGKISNQFIDALTERAKAGVKVHILVDGMGTLKFRGEKREPLERAGVMILTYGREHWYDIKPNINHRTHRKLLIVDGRIGFTGGMCIADEWMGNAESVEVWRDTVVRVEGPVVRQMQAAFAANWLRTTSSLLLGEEYFPPPTESGTSQAQCFMSGPSEGPQHARLGYLFAIASARQSIDIAHAYFVPDDLAVQMLLDARRRGVRVRVIVPSTSDSAFGRAASRSRWGPLLQAGVEFHRYTGALFHCKSMVVDGSLLTLGSANFDNRSFSINDEVTLNILDPSVAADHVKIFERDLERSPVLDPKEFAARSWWIKTTDRFAGLFRSQF